MENSPKKRLEESESRPWHVLVILLVSLMPATANTFLYSFVMLSAGDEWAVTPFWAAFIGFAPMAAQPVGGARGGRGVAFSRDDWKEALALQEAAEKVVFVFPAAYH